jgi:hypothetical protein
MIDDANGSDGMMGNEEWSKQIDRVVMRTAEGLSAVLDNMVHDLPAGADPQMALEQVLNELETCRRGLYQ